MKIKPEIIAYSMWPDQYRVLILFLSILTVPFLSLQAQTQGIPTLSHDEKRLFDEAKRQAWHGEYEKSNKSFQLLLKKRPDFPEARLRIAANHYSAGKKAEAEELFKVVIQETPDYSPEMYFSLAMVQADLKKFGDAAANYETYACLEKNNPEKVKKALERKEIYRFRDRAIRNPVPYSPVNLGAAVNTSYNEYSPWLSMDGSSLIFTRNTGQEDFYISRKDSLGFTPASPLFELNTPFDEGTFTLSADGSILVFTACNRKDQLGSCDLFYSLYEGGRWTSTANMGKVVNSSAWESQPSLSADGNGLIFSSRRLGTKGGADLFYTYRESNNAWGIPINMGDSINTAGDEESPFLHPDGKTLYFRSNGWPGMGGYDVFVSRKDDSTGLWSKPVNLGFPLNTEGSEGGFMVSLDGNTAFMSSDVNPVNGQKTGHLDVYTFPLYTDARPSPTAFIAGNIKDSKTKENLSAQIRLISLCNQKAIYSAKADKEGVFFIPAPTGCGYACIFEHPGYAYTSLHLDSLTHPERPNKEKLEIFLQPIPKKQVDTTALTEETVTMENVFFNFNSAVLKPESDVEIQQLFALLKNQPDLHVTITGHTDNTGDEAVNIALSLARARAVAEALIKKGIDAKRIETAGKGSSEPIATNLTQDGRRKNRRTEFTLQRL